MLQPNIQLDSTTREDAIIRDVTGDYSAENAGGYGSDNPLRNTLYGTLIAELKSNGKSRRFQAIDYNPMQGPLNSDIWKVNLYRDGFYRFLLVLCPVWDELTEYVEGQVVILDNQHYEATTASLGAMPIEDSDFWKPLEYIDDFAMDNLGSGAYYSYLPYIHNRYSRHVLKEEMVDLAQAGLSKFDKYTLTRHTWRRALYKAAIYEAGWLHFEKSGELMDELVRELKHSKHSH